MLEAKPCFKADSLSKGAGQRAAVNPLKFAAALARVGDVP